MDRNAILVVAGLLIVLGAAIWYTNSGPSGSGVNGPAMTRSSGPTSGTGSSSGTSGSSTPSAPAPSAPANK